MKQRIKRLANRFGFDIRRVPQVPDSIPDSFYYRPYFSPWYGYGDFKAYFELIKPHTIVSPDRCYVLYSLALQALKLDGEWYECGVYKGGTAMLFASLLGGAMRVDETRKLHLFDTFEGMPETQSDVDVHKKGDFSDISLEAVQARLSSVVSCRDLVQFHKGIIPDTFSGLEAQRIAFAYVDVDIYQSIKDCCDFIYPRLVPGGFLVVDDYGMPTCPGARKATDDFFSDKPEVPLILPTGQAVVFKSFNNHSG